MYDVAELERQWRRYRRKRRLRQLGVVVVLALAGSGIAWLAQHPRYFMSVTAVAGSEPNHTAQSVSAEPPVALPMTNAVPTVAAEQDRPPKKMTFVFDDGTVPPTVEGNDTNADGKVAIEVTAQKVTQTVEQLEEKFEYDKDKEDALFLARYYYDKQDYNRAMKWALETNKLDSDIEESWLIFAKAKAKTGKRVEAIRILQTYFDRTGSVTAKQLLGLIRRGKPF
jgi:tetratricopeptide (TPR) repeat protein